MSSPQQPTHLLCCRIVAVNASQTGHDRHNYCSGSYPKIVLTEDGAG